MPDIGRYAIALAVYDGLPGGKAVGDGSIFILCPSLGPNICQMSLL